MGRFFSKGLLVGTLILSAWFFLCYGRSSYPFNGDAMGYYMYLPSTFIYHNHKALDWLPEKEKFDYRVQFYVDEIRREGAYTPKGYLIDKYTYGVAALELPFFFLAHAWEKVIGGNADGYSASYCNMVKLSSAFYALLGILLLYKILQHFFGNTLAAAGTVITFAGTNLFWFSVYQAGMAHVPLFFLYSLLLYTTILLDQRPRPWLFVTAGIAAGLITIIRPTDIICLLIPLLYNLYNKETLRQKITLFREQYKGLALFTVAFLLPIIPQLLYWKKFAGSFLYYSYSKETFIWNDPKIWEGLFGFKNGWFIYTPLMLLAVGGLFLYKRIKPVAIMCYLMLPVYVYVVYSWHCYNYINGLGSRPMIHMYPLLAIPLTAFLQYCYSKKLLVRSIATTVVLLFVSVNLSYSLQQARGILFSEESNATYNLHMLFHMNATYNDLVMMDTEVPQPDEQDIEKMATLGCNTHEDTAAEHIPDPTGLSRSVFYLPRDQEYYPGRIWLNYSKAVFGKAQYIKCSGRFSCPDHYTYYKHLLTLHIRNKKNKKYWWGCRIDNKLGLTEPGTNKREFTIDHREVNKWGKIWFYVPIPDGLEEGDQIRMDVWNIGWQPIYIDDVCMELYRNKE
jgi:hypothetical protein